MYKGKCWIVTTLLLMLIFYLSSCNNSNEIGTREESLSNYILGEWSGQVDVADIMYKELGDELGIDLSPEPEYCDVSISFHEDNTYAYTIDVDGFAKAAGKCVEPYVSGIMGFSTESLINLIVQYVADDISPETGTEEGSYTINNEQMGITVSDGNGNEKILYLMEDGSLQYEDDEIDQVITFRKN